MTDKARHPLFGILADMLATQTGQRVASDYKTVQDAAVNAADYAEGAPGRVYDRATGQVPLSPQSAVGGIVDAGLLAAPVFGAARAAKAGVNAVKGLVGPNRWQTSAPGEYTRQHTRIARQVLEDALKDPSKSVNAKSLAEYVRQAFAKAGAPKTTADLDKLASGTMKRLQVVDPNDADAVRSAVTMATGLVSKSRGPLTLGVAGMAGAGAMGEGDDPQRAQVADIIRRIRAGEL